MRNMPAIFFLAFFIPLSAGADSILGGVARTVEDIGGQIVGNPAAKRGDRARDRLENGSAGNQEEHLQVIEAEPYRRPEIEWEPTATPVMPRKQPEATQAR